MGLIDAFGRAAVGGFFVHSGQRVLRNPTMAAGASAPTLDALRRVVRVPVGDVALVRANAALHILAGSLVAAGRTPRLASLVLAASLVPTTAAGHPFWTLQDPASRRQQRNQFEKNVAIWGGLLMTIGSPRPGPGRGSEVSQ